MVRRLSMVLLAAIAIMAMLQSSSATDHVVGDAPGWLVPPGGATFYSTWAANKTFRAGDTLVFNFANGQHDVARVTKANYDACNTNSPILLLTNSPANVSLNETGDHYFICTFGTHCSLGQKLAINVTAATPSPAPQPSTPPPSPSSPAPQPATPPPASTPQPSIPAPAPQAGSPSPTSPPSPAPSMPTPSPSPSMATPPPTATPPSTSGTSPPPSVPSTPSPSQTNGPTPPTASTPPPPGNSATCLSVAGLSTAFLSLIVLALFM